MKIEKLQKIIKGERPIIRVTYHVSVGLFGRLKKVSRDVTLSELKNYWLFMDNGDYFPNQSAIYTFNESESEYYILN